LGGELGMFLVEAIGFGCVGDGEESFGEDAFLFVEAGDFAFERFAGELKGQIMVSERRVAGKFCAR
jgi:hypothetical protein